MEIQDKIVEKVVEMGEATVTYKDQQPVVMPTKTIYTIWQSGRKDCHVEVLKPIDTVAKEEKLGGK